MSKTIKWIGYKLNLIPGEPQVSGAEKKGFEIKQLNTNKKGEKIIMKKMNNKGFSLVELIVVVLIMAIIAVALAPQVMKWVENSRKSTDVSNYDSIVSAANIALANENVYSYCINKDIEIKATETGGKYTVSDDGTLKNEMKKTLGNDWENNITVKAAVLHYICPDGVTKGEGEYLVTVNSCIVTRAKAPYNPNT